MAQAGGQQSTGQAGRFAAFISNSHADEEFGDWLHKRLERYQVPPARVGRDGPGGPIRKRLGQVFRDRVEFAAAHDLGAEIRAGLEQAARPHRWENNFHLAIKVRSGASALGIASWLRRHQRGSFRRRSP